MFPLGFYFFLLILLYFTLPYLPPSLLPLLPSFPLTLLYKAINQSILSLPGKEGRKRKEKCARVKL